jgi:GWxTD domain-containing protein
MVVLTALAAVGTPSQGQGSGLDVTVARYYRASATQTVLDVFCRVPLTAVSALGGSAGAGAAFRFSFAVKDSSGLTLATVTRTDKVPGMLLGVRGASTGEHMNLRVAPGRYTLEATVTDSATGLVTRGRSQIEAFRSSVGASDLLLGTALRAPTAGIPGDTVPKTGEVWTGVLFVQTSGRPTLTPQQSDLAYYVELYAARPESVTVTARVLGDGGAVVIAAQPQVVAVGAGGGVTYGVLSLAGLPQGKYRLEVGLKSDSMVTRSSGFAMGGFDTEGNIELVADAAPQDVFSEKTEAGLDSMYSPLVYLMNAQESGEYSTLTLDGKRRWLRQFWAKRNPTPGGDRNASMDQYYARIRDAETKFREGGASATPGWRTERGKIYVLYGPPDEELERHSSGSTNPYEVWKYTRERALKFVFMDLTRFGHYALIYTNDRHEQSRPDWQDLLGTDAVQDVNNF